MPEAIAEHPVLRKNLESLAAEISELETKQLLKVRKIKFTNKSDAVQPDRATFYPFRLFFFIYVRIPVPLPSQRSAFVSSFTSFLIHFAYYTCPGVLVGLTSRW